MRPKLSFVWFLVAVAVTALLVVQWRAGQKQKQLLETVQIQVEKLDQKEKTAKARADELLRENGKLRGEIIAAELEARNAREEAAEAATNSIASRSASPRNSDSAKEKLPGQNMLSTMMKDPEMRKMMEQQQRMALEMMYEPLFKKLDLSPEETAELKNLILTNQMATATLATEMVAEGKNAADVGQELAGVQREREEELREFLGEDRYQVYQEYQQTAGERVMLNQFGKQLDLQPDQTEQLLSIIGEEKRNAQINQPIAPNFDPTRDGQLMMTDPQLMERYFEQQELVNQRVIDKAAQILDPDQLERLGPFMNNQLKMQEMGMKMALKMGASEEGAATPTPPQPVQAE